MRSTLHTTALSASLLLPTLFLPSLRALDAQSDSSRTREPADVRIERLPTGVLFSMGASNRAMLGVTLSGDTRADSNGVHIDGVRENGPAAKAGLKVGDVLTEINGTSLRLSAADAADPALDGLAQRRLQRVLGKAKPGDEIELRVQSGGSSRTVKLKATSSAELEGLTERRVGSTRNSRDRAAIGVSVGGSGSMRDTLGLFISSVVAKGPAESAGIVEGERIAAVNGVDVRLPREDAEDARSVEARVDRFVREVQKGEAGATLTLRVYGGGRYREVSVKTVAASTLPSQGFRFNVGDGGDVRVFSGPGQMELSRVPMPPRSPDAPRAPNAPRAPRPPQVFEFDTRVDGGNGRVRINTGDGVREITIEREAIERAMDEVRRSLQGMGQDFRLRLREDGQRTLQGLPQVRVMPRRTVTIL